MGWFGKSDREKNAIELENQMRLFGQQGNALGEKLLDPEQPIRRWEVDSFRQTYDSIIACCEKYSHVDGSSGIKERTVAAFSLVYPKASYRARLASFPEAKEIDALITAYIQQLEVIQSGASSTEDLRELFRVGNELQRSEALAAKYFESEVLERIRELMTQHEEFCSLKAVKNALAEQSHSQPSIDLALTIFEQDCELLGVGAHHTLDELSTARRQKATEWHPDKLDGMAPELREFAGGQLARINGAFERLKDGAQSKWVTHESLSDEADAITQMMNKITTDMGDAISVVKIKGYSAFPQLETLIERWDGIVNRGAAYLARVRRYAPETNTSALEQHISAISNAISGIKDSLSANRQ